MLEEAPKKIDIDYYIKLVLKRRWFILIPFCISMTIGLYLAITLPKIYSAKNLILVIPKSVPDKYVPSVSETDVQQRINTIKQQIMSRTNMEKIIDEFKLFSKSEHAHMYLVDKIKNVRKNIDIKVTKSRRGIDSFTISFQGGNPEKVMNVVNTLAKSFIDESIRVMESEVIETNKFLEGELSVLRTRLQKIEESIKQYRKKYMGELPEELGSNLQTINRLQLQLSEKHENIRNAKNRLAEIEAQIAIAKSNTMSISSAILASRPNLNPKAKPLSELDQLKLQLKNLARYTDKHPDVIRVKAAIAALEASAPQQDNHDTSLEKENPSETKENPPEFDSATLLLKTQYDEIKEEIKISNQNIAKIEALIAKYQKRVENTPKREQDLLDLNRNYTNIQKSYAKLLDRKLDSDIAVNMEKKQKGQKFRVLDTAKLPQKPVSPDMKKLFILFTAAGLGLGAGLIFALDYIDTSLKKPEEIEPMTGIPVLATIPQLHSRKDKIAHKINHAMSVFTAVIAFILFSTFALFMLKGVERTIAAVEKFI